MYKKIFTVLSLTSLLMACTKDKINSAIAVSTDPHPTTFAIYPAPVKGYVGDVIPFYEGNTFHLFYLQDWRDNAPNYHPWYKYTTTNLTNYTYAGQMIGLGTKSEQDFTLGTGSVIKAGNTYYGYYTGHNYLFLGTGQGQEAIQYATSTDLNTWTKKTNYILRAPAGYSINDFRDPFIVYNDATGEYWLIISAQAGGKGSLLYFTTKDLATPNWVYQKPLYTSDKYDMMECPDIFKMGSYWYLVFSDTNLENATHYRISTSLDGIWTTPASDLLDSKYFYAAKTAYDGKNRYLFGWVPTKSGFVDAGNKEFAGNMSTHLLTQNTDGTLSVSVPDAVTNSFTKENPIAAATKTSDVTATGSDYQLTSANALSYALFGNIKGTSMITGTLSFAAIPQNFGILLGSNTDVSQAYKLGFINGNMQSDRVASGNTVTEASIPFSLSTGKDYPFKVVIENSIATLYVNGQTALSTRIYSLQNRQWGIFSTNGSVTVKNLKLFSLK
ncbi:glycoside hydrolase family 32 protein [Mucilaginibacter pineti]|nr:glycoside hydrolase family 32 protein [Mucilaginibacter pineti]